MRPEWSLKLHQANLDLPVLVGYLVSRAWRGSLPLGTVVRDEAKLPAATAFLHDLAAQARLPDAKMAALAGDFPMRNHARGSCLFLLDSGCESALA